MRSLRAIFTLAAMLYPAHDVIPEQEWSGWQPWMFGAPCSLQSDFENGVCLNFTVKQKPDWTERKRRGMKK